MQKRSDETLVAYLDGELDGAERQHVEAWLAADAAARDRLTDLAQSTNLLRSAYADIVNEPVPDRLIAAARGEINPASMPQREAEILVLKRPPRRIVVTVPGGRWGIGIAAAAGLFGLVVGGAGSYLATGLLSPGSPAAEQRLAAAAANNTWLDNAAGYYKLAVSAGDSLALDVPASSDAREALQRVNLEKTPNLVPWGLNFRGARLVVVEGKPAVQLVYTTDNKAIGPLTLVIGASKQPDTQPTFDHRQDVNLLYWRHQGRAYALVGQTDIGYLWGIANDVGWQLDAI